MAISCTAPRKPSPHNPIPESQTLPDNPRGGLFLCCASVGEDSIPRAEQALNHVLCWANSYNLGQETIQPNTQKPKPGGRLIASPTAAGDPDGQQKQAAFFYEAACGYLSDFGGFFKGTLHNGAKDLSKPAAPIVWCCLMCGARSVPCIWGR